MGNTGTATASEGGIAVSGHLYIEQLVQHLPAAGLPSAGLPPPPTKAVPTWVIDRIEADQVIDALCAPGSGAVGITTGLQGAGGFGKTTLAAMACASSRVQEHFEGRVYMVTVGRDVRGPAPIAAKVGEVTRFVTGDTTTFSDPDVAGAHLGRLLDSEDSDSRRILLVLDDIWERQQLDPFLIGGRRCVRLVTTRVPEALPADARRVRVDQMAAAQARQILTWDLPPLPETLVAPLLKATGRWPLLLRLTNRAIAVQAATGADPARAAEAVLRQLHHHGPAAADDPTTPLDVDDPRQRSKLVAATLKAATSLLSAGGEQRFAELGIFAEDEAVPVPLIAKLWQATAGLEEFQARRLLHAMSQLSLLTMDTADGGRLALHDVIRDYLRASLAARLSEVNAALVDAIEASLPMAEPLAPSVPSPGAAWWEVDDDYLLDHAIGHLLDADRPAQAEAVAGDLRWVERRLHQRGPTAPWTDLTQLPTTTAAQRARELAAIAHLLTPTEPAHAQTAVLHSRLEPLPVWHDQVLARQTQTESPRLVNHWPPPDLPQPALVRTLVGHIGLVSAVAIAPDGTWLASTGDDGTVRLWDAATGQPTATLTGHTDEVRAVAIAPDGSWLATTGDDGTVRLWDAATGRPTGTLRGHTRSVSAVAIAPDGTWLATTSWDQTVRLWDAATGRPTATLTGHDGPVSAVAIAPDGTWLATTSHDNTIRIWDTATGRPTATPTGHTDEVRAVAIAPDGTWLATTGSRTARLWDAATGRPTATLTGHDGLGTAVAIAPDGTWLATTNSDGTARLWNAATGQPTATLTGHTNWLSAVAIAPDGTWLATTSADHTVRIWNPSTSQLIATLRGHTKWVSAVAIAPDSAWLATTSDDNTIRIWDTATGRPTATLTGHTDEVKAVAIAPDGTWLATTSADRTVRLWDTATGRPTATLTGHTDWVSAVAIAPNGTWLATTSGDGTLRIWDRVSQRVTALMHTDGALYACTWTPDGCGLIAGGEQGIYFYTFHPGPTFEQ